MKSIFAFLLFGIALGVKAENEAKNEYPLSTCVISGETLGEMGEPFVYKYKGRDVLLCCKDCVSDFEEDAAAYLKLIDEAQQETATNNVVELKHDAHRHESAPAEPAK